MKNVLKHKEMGLVIILVAVSFIITIKNPAFLSVDNIMNILKGNVVLAIVSLGMLLVMITGGIDVSVGGIIAATTLFVGNFMVSYTGNVILSFFSGYGDWFMYGNRKWSSDCFYQTASYR